MTRYRVSHRTRYTYDAPVGSCVDLAVMTPRVTPTAARPRLHGSRWIRRPTTRLPTSIFTGTR